MFIVFEGIDGSGKSTLANALAETLSKTHDVILTKEPSGIYREILINSDPTPTEEFFLFMADRAAHVKKIKEWQAQGKIVICDRFSDSTYAYQGLTAPFPFHFIISANEKACDSIVPDKIFTLILDPKNALQRATEKNRYEARGLEYYQKLHDYYRDPFDFHNNHIFLDASLPKEELLQQILNHLKELD